MGTSDAYTGAGGKAGKDVSEGLGEWIDSLPVAPVGGDRSAPAEAPDRHPARPVTQLPPKVVSGLMGLLRPRSGRPASADGRGSGGGGVRGGVGAGSGGGDRTRSGSGRSIQRLSSAGGRAAAGAYAFTQGDAAGLLGLGLDYGELRALNDPFEVTRRIVDAVCGQQADSRLEGAEERYVAASVADWVLTQNEQGSPPELDEVARYAIATIVVEVLNSELAVELRERPDEVAVIAEDELRDAAAVVAGQATLTLTGPTEAELTTAIEEGIETLRSIYGAVS